MNAQMMQILFFNMVMFQRLSSVIGDVAKQYLSVYLFKEIFHLPTKQI